MPPGPTRGPWCSCCSHWHASTRSRWPSASSHPGEPDRQEPPRDPQPPLCPPPLEAACAPAHRAGPRRGGGPRRAGRVGMAISYEPELLLARDRGLNVVSIGALVQRPLTSIIALPSKHVRGVASLGRKHVGTAGIEYQQAELHTALEHAGVKPSSV